MRYNYYVNILLYNYMSDHKFLGRIDMSGVNIINVADPVDDQDAATKAYVSTQIGTVPKKESYLVGDNTNTTFVVNHGLDTQDFTYSARFTATGAPVAISIVPTTNGSVTVSTAATIVLDTNEVTITLLG